MLTKLAFIGRTGSGISLVAELFSEKYYNFSSRDHSIGHALIRSLKNGEFEIFDVKGLDAHDNMDSIQKMISNLQNEKINAIFIVSNINERRLDQSMKLTIQQICRLFKGKYIWKQIGIIFTYTLDNISEKQKERGKEIIKAILNTAENEYKEIIRTQDQNNKNCDPNEKLVDTLNYFYIQIPEEDESYDYKHSLEEINKIKNLVKYYPPITQVQSEFIVKKEIIKDKKATIARDGEESVFPSVLRSNGGLAGFGLGLLSSPLSLLGGILAVRSGVVGEPLEVYDEEVIYWSTGRIEKNKINIRHQTILGNEI